ncbi:MAG TPA: alpha/beta hydrolase, partial [Acinetobacter sp.]|nr:alpha/beta hydrolase [Acinetobacter sp.]
QAWKLNPINLGKVGHINVAAGFGPFPEILNYMLPENNHQPVKRMRQTPFNLKFA